MKGVFDFTFEAWWLHPVEKKRKKKVSWEIWMRLFNNCFNIDFVNGVWFIMNGHNYYLSSRKVLKVLFSQARNKNKWSIHKYAKTRHIPRNYKYCKTRINNDWRVIKKRKKGYYSLINLNIGSGWYLLMSTPFLFLIYISFRCFTRRELFEVIKNYSQRRARFFNFLK